MFITAVCVIFLIKLRWPRNKSLYAYVMFFVFFPGCLYTYSLNNKETVTEFISPKFFGEGFPYSQKCKWRFVVPQDKRLQIDILEAYLEGDDTIDIHNEWDNGGSSLGAIKSTKPPAPGGYSSRQNVITLEFESKSSGPSRKRSRGFRGTFKSINIKGEFHVWQDNYRMASLRTTFSQLAF